LRILVTGGAGYIGAHVVRALHHDGHVVAVLDDLSTGSRARLTDDIEFHLGSVLDTATVADTLRAHRADLLVHMAGKKSVNESVEEPLYYYRENAVGMHSLLTAMAAVGTRRILFSSTAAVYGIPTDGSVTETSPTLPLSPYGWSKLMSEQMIRDTAQALGMSWASLRYFNVAGAADPALADHGASNLIPSVFRAVGSGIAPKVFGADYPTPDGTCIRDYIHVEDLADAHAAVIRRMAVSDMSSIYNVGTGSGASVLAVIEAVREVTGDDFPIEICPRRAGDPARVVADPTKIHTELNWSARHDLRSIVRSSRPALLQDSTDKNRTP
jgi:UDP-glucose 4-epimerase